MAVKLPKAYTKMVQHVGSLSANLEIDLMACDIAHNHQDKIMGFILDLDLEMADYDFTKELIQKLQQSLREDIPWKDGETNENSL